MNQKTRYPILAALGAALLLLLVLPVVAEEAATRGPAMSFDVKMSGRLELRVNGPEELTFEKIFEEGTTPVFGLFNKAGTPQPDGIYRWELRLAPTTSAQSRDSQTAIEKRRAPVMASGTFAIADGEFVPPDLQEEAPEKALFHDIPTKDVLHYDDVIITGSLCVGFDCINGEDFGYSTIKMKENNLQFEFDDTSIGTFPTNNWKIQINDTTSGGASYWTLWDVDGGRRPFTIEAGAPAHSLYVEDYGRVGLGTSIPYVELHIVDGDSPTIRLDQDGSSGWTAQSWDLCGNETNFFIRDVTNGSKLPFRLQPNTPSNTLTMRSTGYVGIGTWSPADRLEIESTDAPGIRIHNLSAAGTGWVFRVTNADEFRISRDGSGEVELEVEPDGDLVIAGSLTTAGDTYPDYVFEDGYRLMPLAELETFVAENKHLPNVPTATEVDGGKRINMTELQIRLLEKVEELTLYTLAQEKTIAELKARLATLEQAGK